MVIRIDPPLRCAQKAGPPAGKLCRELAVLAVIVPLEDNTWHMFPLCSYHFREAGAIHGQDLTRRAPAEIRTKEPDLDDGPTG